MHRILALFITVVALCGCAHKDLKAPCSNIVGFAADNIPCDQRDPVNRTNVPSIFAE